MILKPIHRMIAKSGDAEERAAAYIREHITKPERYVLPVSRRPPESKWGMQVQSFPVKCTAAKR
jgi:uncharacterized protein (DUF2126 family)